MGKYTFLLFKTLLITIFFFNFQKILGNEKFKAENSKSNEVRDWIELFKKEIRGVHPNEIGGKEEIKTDESMESKNSKKRIIDEIGTGLSDKAFILIL